MYFFCLFKKVIFLHKGQNYFSLTLSWRRLLSYRNQSIDLLRKSVNWFLYDSGLRHERIKLEECCKGHQLISCHWPLSIPPENMWYRKRPVITNGLKDWLKLNLKIWSSNRGLLSFLYNAFTVRKLLNRQNGNVPQVSCSFTTCI